MREISTKKLEIGEHVLIDGVEFVVEEGSCRNCELARTCEMGYLCPPCGHLKKVKKEPTFRPYKDTEEMLEDWHERFEQDWPKCQMPLIWVMCGATKTLITGYIGTNSVTTYGINLTLVELFEEYTYLDGSPCGKEIEG